MARHVAFVEAHGAKTPERSRRQHALIAAVAQQYRPLRDKRAHQDKPTAGFAFSKRTTAAEAVARLTQILDSVEADWRDYVRVWDGSGRKDDSEPILSDPPRTGFIDFLRLLFRV